MKKQKSSFKQKLLDVWSKIKRPLFYCSIALNILFVAIAIVGCIVPSKRDGSSTSNESETIQLPQRKNMLNETITDLTDTTWVINDNIDVAIEDTAFSYFLNFVSNSSNYTLFQCQLAGKEPALIYNADNVYEYESGWLNNEYKTISISGGNDSTNSNLISWLSTNAVLQTTPTNVSENLTIFLGDSFVPSVYIASNGNYIFNGFGGYMNTPDTFTIDFTGFTFESNGRQYNRVRFLYLPLTAGASFVTQDGSTGTDVTSFSNYVFCNGIYYMNFDEEDNLLYSNTVASPRRKVVNVSGNELNIFDVRVPFLVWVNDNYRTLNIIQDTHQVVTDSHLIYQNMSAVELLQVTSNVNQSVTGLSNVTDILKGGFSSISSLLQMNILPGITIGLLLFIPLIVTIILTILKLVKK